MNALRRVKDILRKLLHGSLNFPSEFGKSNAADGEKDFTQCYRDVRYAFLVWSSCRAQPRIGAAQAPSSRSSSRSYTSYVAYIADNEWTSMGLFHKPHKMQLHSELLLEF